MGASREHRFEMPNGLTFRTRSTKRYVVVLYRGGIVKWTAQYRTDVESRAVAQWRHQARLGMAALVDTTTGTVIR